MRLVLTHRNLSVALPGIPAWTDQNIDLYHGTLDLHVSSVLTAVDVGRGAALKDFGRGFYTTTSLSQATNWANNLAIGGGTPAVVCFTVERDKLARLDTLAFVRGEPAALDFWSFVQYCRTIPGSHNRRQSPWYDAVIGPVTGSWKKQTVIRNADQISFHTDHAETVLNNCVHKQRVV